MHLPAGGGGDKSQQMRGSAGNGRLLLLLSVSALIKNTFDGHRWFFLLSVFRAVRAVLFTPAEVLHCFAGEEIPWLCRFMSAVKLHFRRLDLINMCDHVLYLCPSYTIKGDDKLFKTCYFIYLFFEALMFSIREKPQYKIVLYVSHGASELILFKRTSSECNLLL